MTQAVELENPHTNPLLAKLKEILDGDIKDNLDRRITQFHAMDSDVALVKRIIQNIMEGLKADIENTAGPVIEGAKLTTIDIGNIEWLILDAVEKNRNNDKYFENTIEAISYIRTAYLTQRALAVEKQRSGE